MSVILDLDPRIMLTRIEFKAPGVFLVELGDFLPHVVIGYHYDWVNLHHIDWTVAGHLDTVLILHCLSHLK